MNFLFPAVTPVTDVCRLVVPLAVSASMNGEEPARGPKAQQSVRSCHQLAFELGKNACDRPRIDCVNLRRLKSRTFGEATLKGVCLPSKSDKEITLALIPPNKTEMGRNVLKRSCKI